MKNKYIVSIELVREYEAQDENEALKMFYEELATANESIENFIEIKQITNYEDEYFCGECQEEVEVDEKNNCISCGKHIQ